MGQRTCEPGGPGQHPAMSTLRGRTAMRMLSSLLVVVALGAALVVPARAVICAIDDVPAATLLLPYFEVSLDDPGAIQTLFSINNASATAVLAHVVVWS